MNCSSCGSETNGIKLNGKTYCPFCGEQIAEESAKEALEEISQEPVAKFITNTENQPPVEEANANVLKAEEEVLNILEEVNKRTDTTENKIDEKFVIPDSYTPIKKANRTRLGHHKDFTPEEKQVTEVAPTAPKVSPEVVELKETTEEELTYPLLDKRQLEDIESERNKKKEVLKNYIKSNVHAPVKTKRKKKKNLKKFWLILVIILAIISGVALTFYVNLFVMNPQKSKEKAEVSVGFKAIQPQYLPAGYSLKYVENPSDKELVYHYTYLKEEDRTLNITEKKTDEKDIYNSYIKNILGIFVNFKTNEIDYWYVNETTLIYKDNLLFIIESSQIMGKEELLKIAEGLKS